MKPVLRAVVALAAVAFLTVTTTLTASARPTTINDTGRNFADPGLVWTGSVYALYGTGAGFPAASAEGYTDTFRAQGDSLPVASLPGWVGIAPGWGGRRLWAPSVVKVGSEYVMYYTAWHGAQGRNCIGVATSATAFGRFTPRGTAFCAPAGAGSGAEAIDPSAYVSAEGNCYMMFKTSIANARAWKIWAKPMGRNCRTFGATAKVKINAASRMEAPSVVRHGGHVWLFVSRNDYKSCAYNVQVWRADSLWAGTFRAANSRVILNQGNTGKCGPGGATVINLPGGGTRIAFHAWDRGTPSSDVRSAYMAIVRWRSTGWPYVA